jgi:amino acid transporter
MILFFAFTGIEVAVSNGGEFKNPSRTVPIGIIAGIISVLVIYLLIQIVSQGILGAALPQFKEAPLAEVANRAIGWSGLFLISFGMFFSILGSVSGEVLGSSRMLFAGARDGIYPHLLFKTHKKFFTPYWSVLVYCAADLCMSLIGNFKQLILLASTAILLVYLGVVWAAWKIKLNKKRRAEKGFSMPGGWVIPLLTTLIIFWLLFQLSLMEIYGTLAFLAISSLIYLGIFLYKKGKKPGS